MADKPTGSRTRQAAEYLAEAERCDRFADRCAGVERERWLDLARRWRLLFEHLNRPSRG